MAGVTGVGGSGRAQAFQGIVGSAAVPQPAATAAAGAAEGAAVGSPQGDSYAMSRGSVSAQAAGSRPRRSGKALGRKGAKPAPGGTGRLAGLDPKTQARVKEFEKMAGSDPLKAAAYLGSLSPADLAAVVKHARNIGALNEVAKDLPAPVERQLTRKIADTGDAGAVKAWRLAMLAARGRSPL